MKYDEYTVERHWTGIHFVAFVLKDFNTKECTKFTEIKTKSMALYGIKPINSEK